MSNSGARKGDRVRVSFAMLGRGHDVIGCVQYAPCSTGDSWIIHADGGRIFHVQMFETIEVLDREVDPDAQTRNERMV